MVTGLPQSKRGLFVDLEGSWQDSMRVALVKGTNQTSSFLVPHIAAGIRLYLHLTGLPITHLRAHSAEHHDITSDGNYCYTISNSHHYCYTICNPSDGLHARSKCGAPFREGCGLGVRADVLWWRPIATILRGLHRASMTALSTASTL